MRQDTPDASVSVVADTTPAIQPRARKESRIWRRTTMRHAIVEALGIYIAARLLAMVPANFWPLALFPLILILRLVLTFSPPVWAAARVVSTKREKMSRRFWKLGWQLAAVCALADAVIALFLGDFYFLGGPAGPPDITRFGLHGTQALSPGGFLLAEVGTFIFLALYFTIAVVCTRLANGGFMRFTMPAGNGRVTL
ncbi:MAG TPA: hypothetical protein VKQ30_08815 [Ktedonobacterales bacterium]|nr:hypothetical protein [Ktedonobacterales bacterium]